MELIMSLQGNGKNVSVQMKTATQTCYRCVITNVYILMHGNMHAHFCSFGVMVSPV